MLNSDVMKQLLIGFLFVVFLCNSASAQVRVTDRKLSRAEIARLNAESKRDSIASTFEHLELNGKPFRSRIERIIIPRGDSTRIKFVFDNTFIRVAVEGGGETTPEDIKKGSFMAVIRPQKTTWVKFVTEQKYPGIEKIMVREHGYRVIVVDPEKYDSIMVEYNKLEDYSKERSAFLDTLSGGSWNDFKSGKIK